MSTILLLNGEGKLKGGTEAQKEALSVAICSLIYCEHLNIFNYQARVNGF